MAHTPSISKAEVKKDDVKDDQFLKIVKNITSKGFVRSNYEEKLVDLSDVRINLKVRVSSFLEQFLYLALLIVHH